MMKCMYEKGTYKILKEKIQHYLLHFPLRYIQIILLLLLNTIKFSLALSKIQHWVIKNYHNTF